MTRKRQISKRFSEAAKYYHDHATVQRDIASDIVKLLGDQLLSGKCIDVGCGTGFLAAELASRNPTLDVLGIDVASGMIEQAKSVFDEKSNLKFICADGSEKLPVDNYDFLVSSSSLQWMYPFESTLKNWVGVLSPTGKLVISVMVPGTLAEIKQVRESITGKSAPENLPTLAEIVEILQNLGVTVRHSASKDYTVNYRNADELLEDLRNLGVNAPLRDEPDPKLTPEELGQLKIALNADRKDGHGLTLSYKVGFIVAERRV